MGVGAGQGDVELCSGMFDDGIGMSRSLAVGDGDGDGDEMLFGFASSGSTETGLCFAWFFNAVTARM
jgi:hypothetical protein